MPSPVSAIGYLRVSTTEQGESGAGMKAQRAAIVAACEQRGWELCGSFTDTASGRTMRGREGLREALRRLAGGEADALVVAKLDRLSRSLLDFAGLIELSRKEGWSLVALDVDVDTSTPAGEMVANVLAVFAQFERRLIGQRTRDALDVKRREGVRLGRPPAMPEEVRERIRAERKTGQSYRAIADGLNAEGVPTAQGGARWHPSTVRAALLAG